MQSPLLKTGSELGDPTRSIWDTFQTYIIKNYAPTNCIQLHNPSWSQPIKWLIRSRTLIATRPRSWRTLGQTNMFHNNRLSEHVWMGQTLNFHHLSPVRDHELDMWWLHLMLHPSWDTRTASVRPGGALHTPVLQIGHSEFHVNVNMPSVSPEAKLFTTSRLQLQLHIDKILTQLIPSLPWFSLRIFSKGFRQDFKWLLAA